MKAFWIGVFALLLFGIGANAQGLPDEQIVQYRIGASFDSTELRYFGLQTQAGEPVDSMQYGIRSGAFVLIPYQNGQPRQLVLTPAAQREFLRYVAHYEEFVREPVKLDVKSLAPLRFPLTLARHERNGRFAEVVTTAGRTFFGEVAFVREGYVGLYGVDLGYEAELAMQEVSILRLDSLTNIRIYKRSAGRYVGLALGVAAAGSMTAFGTSLTEFSSANTNYVVSFVALPAIGFAVGYLLDISLGFSSKYDMAKPARAQKGFSKLGGRVMFSSALPPELRHRLDARKAVR